MAIAYFDSSAFVKLVVDEDGSDLAASLWDGCDAVVSSRLSHPEVRAALAAAGRDHRLTAVDQQHAQAAWAGFWAATRPVELTAAITAHAGELAGRYALPGTDAVHLASCLAVGREATVFAVWTGGCAPAHTPPASSSRHSTSSARVPARSTPRRGSPRSP